MRWFYKLKFAGPFKNMCPRIFLENLFLVHLGWGHLVINLPRNPAHKKYSGVVRCFWSMIWERKKLEEKQQICIRPTGFVLMFNIYQLWL